MSDIHPSTAKVEYGIRIDKVLNVIDGSWGDWGLAPETAEQIASTVYDFNNNAPSGAGKHDLNVTQTSSSSSTTTTTSTSSSTSSSFAMVDGQRKAVYASVRGGNVVRITGTGFSNIGMENEIMIGGGACVVISSSFRGVTCYTPFARSVHKLDHVCHPLGNSKYCQKSDGAGGGHGMISNTSSAVATSTGAVIPGSWCSGTTAFCVTWSAAPGKSGHVTFALNGTLSAGPSWIGIGWQGPTMDVVNPWLTSNSAENAFNLGTQAYLVDWGFATAAGGSLTIVKGSTVTWRLKLDGAMHSIVSGHWNAEGTSDGNFNSGKMLLVPGKEWSHTFTETGTFPYFCGPHKSMTGTITVVNEPSNMGYEQALNYQQSASGLSHASRVVMCARNGSQVVVRDSTGVADSSASSGTYDAGSNTISCAFTRPASARDLVSSTGKVNVAYAIFGTGDAGVQGVQADAPMFVAALNPAVADVDVRIYHYNSSIFEGGVFSGGFKERSDCLSEMLDGAWSGWSNELEQKLADTKYYGYSCKGCKKQNVIAHKRTGTMIGDVYSKDPIPEGIIDGAWSQWQDSSNYSAWEGSGASNPSPYSKSGLSVTGECRDDLAVLSQSTGVGDGGWSSWGHPGQWSAWYTAPNDTYQFDWEHTPIITSISPTSFSSALSTRVTIHGDFKAFRADAQYGCRQEMRVVSPSGLFRTCQQLEVKDTVATCVVVRGKPFPMPEQQKMFPRLSLCAASGVPVVAHPEPDCCSSSPYIGRVDIALRVESTHPKTGSLAGGTLVTIKGAGFANETDKIVRSADVQLLRPNDSGQHYHESPRDEMQDRGSELQRDCVPHPNDAIAAPRQTWLCVRWSPCVHRARRPKRTHRCQCQRYRCYGVWRG